MRATSDDQVERRSEAVPSTIGPGHAEVATDDLDAPGGGVVPGGGFDALFERERTPMVRLAYLMVGAESVAEEVVQEAFTTVYVRWPGLQNPGGYLRRCVVNGANRHIRRRKLERRKLVVVVDEAVDLEARELLDALASLRPAWRAVVVLRFYEGMSQEEIAETLGMRLGTVKSSLHRALGQLREEMSGG